MTGMRPTPAAAAARPLRASVAEQQRYRERVRLQRVVAYVSRLLSEAGIPARVKVSLHHGRPFVVVMSRQRDEAALTVPPVVGGYVVHCAWETRT